jgi:3-hydroxybutyryl-CoA dehydrogenase
LDKLDEKNFRPSEFQVGLIGMGLMGRSIATCLLAAGHPLVAIILDMAEEEEIRKGLYAHLKQLREEKITLKDPNELMEHLTLSVDFNLLSRCDLILESITENVESKKAVFKKIESVVSDKIIIGSNTSAIPISLLQEGAKHPERFIGIHWGEPAHITRFMEIICGDQTDITCGHFIKAIASYWNKEPSLLLKDIRGFITNRIFYAMLREALHLVESGVCGYEDVDRSLRNDYGSWISLTGLFRFIDLTGLPAYLTVMEDLNKELCNRSDAPKLMKDLVASGAKGTSNQQGFYSYTPESAQMWDKKFMEFNYDIRKLVGRYLHEKDV